MKINSLKKNILSALITALFLILPAVAEESIISSVVISKAKDKPNGYELNIDSTKTVNFKTKVENDKSIYFELKDSVLAHDAGTVYDDVVDVDNVVVKQLDKNKVRIYIQGKYAKNTELSFINHPFEAKTENNSKSITINHPISEYKSTQAVDAQEEMEDWDENSFNPSHLAAAILVSLKDGVMGMVLILLSLFALLAVVFKNLTAKVSADKEPLIGLNDSRLSTQTRQINSDELESISNRNQTLIMAQKELSRAHEKYQQYLKEKYKNTTKPKTQGIDPIKKGIAINQYQKSTQNPYTNQEVIRLRKESLASNYPQNLDLKNGFKIPPKPKTPEKTEFSSPYIKRNNQNREISQPAQTNMKFLESVTKIYEQSGRKDLANGLKNSMSRAKQSI